MGSIFFALAMISENGLSVALFTTVFTVSSGA